MTRPGATPMKSLLSLLLFVFVLPAIEPAVGFAQTTLPQPRRVELPRQFIVPRSEFSEGREDAGSLYALASQYEREIEAFEKIILRVRGIDRSDERLVDQLDDESGRLRQAARNPRHFNRMFRQWREVQALRQKTGSSIFNKYTPQGDLIRQWERVLYAEDLFAEKFVLKVENPGHRNSVRRLGRPSVRRDAYLLPLAQPPED